MPKRILIVTGELSGDLHAAELVSDIKKAEPSTYCYGIGGKHMREAGAEIILEAHELAVVGLVEIVTHFPKIKNAYKKLIHELKTNPPDVLILVDYPGFNLYLAKKAKHLGVKVLYYISPQIWAWRAGRIKKIKQRVDHMAVIFPFEVDIYKKAGVPVNYVGHPLTRTVKTELSAEDRIKYFNLDKNTSTIGLVPGSRQSEIKRLLPVMVETAKLLKQQLNNIQFILPVADSIDRAQLEAMLPDNLNIKLTTEKRYDVFSTCDAIIATSGTVTLEIALLGTPLVVIYKMSSVSYWIAKLLVKLPYIALCNIVAGEVVAKEFIQSQATPQNIAKEIQNLIINNNEAKLTLGKVQKAINQAPIQNDLAELALDSNI